MGQPDRVVEPLAAPAPACAADPVGSRRTSATAVAELRRRAEYTHRYNTRLGRHGWLRLTPAYSLRIVEELMADHGPDLRVLDPFCGAGTTALAAANRGHEAGTVDINPFLVWFTRAKTATYGSREIAEAETAGEAVLQKALQRRIDPAEEPPLHRIERWWPSSDRMYLRYLKAAIEDVSQSDHVRDLLNVAFCRLVIRLSSAAFNHQSMSFKEAAQSELDLAVDAGDLFRQELRFVTEGASYNPKGSVSVVLGDSRGVEDCFDELFDLVVTSPPYANRMSYIRELRPYMYWLGYLQNGREAGELDWQAIGGTWGVATSRLGKWQRAADVRLPDELLDAVGRIAESGRSNGSVLAAYVEKYGQDVAQHLASVGGVLNRGARAHYIVGNSVFYGVLVAVEQVYAELMRSVGFEDVEVRAIRKRNSRKELVEFCVSGTFAT